jgi:acylphosphatase
MERREVRYTGRVQGVGFRATARSIAAGHAVTGWARNEADGTVRVQIQGEGRDIDACLGELARVMARNIDSAHAHAVPIVPGEAVFEIRR